MSSVLNIGRWGLLLLLSIVGSSSLWAEETIFPTRYTFTAKDFSLTGPTQIEGGWQTIRLVNKGRDFHQIQFLKLPPGKSSEDFRKAMRAANWRALPPWIKRHGGVNSVSPGNEGTVLMNLVPGEYLLMCGIPDRRGRPHVAHGMLSSLVVTPPSSTAPSPQADILIKATDFSFMVEGLLQPGPHVLRFKNMGSQAHEALLIRLNPGASTLQFLEFYRPGGVPNPAGETIGGLVGLAPALEGFIPIELEVGRYGLVCFLADPVTGAPHFVQGMWLDLEVKDGEGADS